MLTDIGPVDVTCRWYVNVSALDLLRKRPDHQRRVLELRLGPGELAERGGQVLLGRAQLVLEDLDAPALLFVLRRQGADRGLVGRVVDVEKADPGR
ncbi:MAG: hypothetical protein E6J28_10635 [Chloroflexi bacterium]|nr:MAG: hypothetical protein E6J28_10635 [Chloroflexota bacterium]